MRALAKLFLGGLWMVLALLTWMWGYAIYKAIGRPLTQTDAGEFLSPNSAGVYPFLFAICAFLLVMVTIWFRNTQWPWPDYTQTNR